MEINSPLFDASEISFTMNEVLDAKPEVTQVNTPPAVEPVAVPQEPQPPVEHSLQRVSDIGLAARYLKDKGLFEIDDADNVTLEDFALKLEEQRQREAETLRQEILDQAGEYRNYLNLKLRGIDQEVIDDIASATIISKIKLDILPEEKNDAEIVAQVERNRERIIAEELKHTGLPQGEISLIVEDKKNKGMLAERALQSKRYFEKDEEARAAYVLQEEERERQAQFETIQRYHGEVESLISSKKIGDYSLNDVEAKDFRKFLSDGNAAVVTVHDENNRPVPVKVSQYQKRLYEFQNSTEQQVAFALWLMKGSNFTAIKNQGKVEQHNAVFDELKRRSSGASSKDTVEQTEDDIMKLVYGEKI